jgi:two-component system, probable response regulator PhcQ
MDSLSQLAPAPQVMRARRILVVDDEEGVCSALRRSLRREKYEVETCLEPKEALLLLKQMSFDMVISDHLMPAMTGLEFMKLVHDRHPDVVRLMLTGHADVKTVIEAINQGEIYRFITKPWDDLELKVTVSLALEAQDLERENRRLLAIVRRHQDFFDRLERSNPGITSVARDASGAILLDGP